MEQTSEMFCDICGYQHFKKNNMRSHMQKHDESRPKHTCHICGKVVLHIKLHIKYAHLNKKQAKTLFPCAHCSEVLTSHNERQKHNKAYHANFTCDICGMTFTKHEHFLTHHSRLHMQPSRKKDAELNAE